MLRFFLLVGLVAPNFAAYLPPKQLPIIPTPPAGRIVGGVETTIEDIPYQVALLWNGNLNCGGSILTPKAILSAAHCNFRVLPSTLSIRAGSRYYNFGGQVIATSYVIDHELFDIFKSFDYDITIVVLSSAIILSKLAVPVTLPPQGLVVPAGSQAQTSGWGFTSEHGKPSIVLRKVEIPIVDQDFCFKAYSTTRYVYTSRMICAGLVEEGGKDACQLDSGGPLVVNNTLVGITSFGEGCALPGYPGVWARVPEFKNWIDDKLPQIV